MSGWLCRPLHGLIWLVGVRRARQLDRDMQRAAFQKALIADIASGHWMKDQGRQ